MQFGLFFLRILYELDAFNSFEKLNWKLPAESAETN